DRIVEVVFVDLREEPGRFREITAHEGLEEIEVEEDFAEIARLLSRGVASAANRVAEIVVDQSGLHRVEIDNRGPFAGEVVYHHVGDLRITMDGAQMQLPSLPGGFEDPDKIASLFHELMETLRL